MRIKKTNILTKIQQDEILDLQDIVFSYDNLSNEVFLSNELNFDRSLPCFYMAYEGDVLVSFMSIFVPTAVEGEIVSFTHPQYRQNGYFKKLLKCAKESLLKEGINKILFQVESKSISGLKVINKMKCNVVEHSEYKMSYDIRENIYNKCNLNFIKVTNENKNIFISITNEGFGEFDEDNGFINALIESNERCAYIAYKDDEPVGCFNLKFYNNEAFLYGLAVVLKYRNKGLGNEIVKFALRESSKRCDKVILEVDSKNPAALNLYKKCGFTIDFQINYYNYEF